MALRKRFKPPEREAFMVGTTVEWLNASTWRPGVVVGPISTNSVGDFYLPIRDVGKRTRTMAPGEVIHASPGLVRLRGS